MRRTIERFTWLALLALGCAAEGAGGPEAFEPEPSDEDPTRAVEPPSSSMLPEGEDEIPSESLAAPVRGGVRAATDLVWRHDSGSVSIWNMAGTYPIGIDSRLPAVDPSWELLTTGDFTVDGHTDYVWRHRADGTIVVWIVQNGILVTHRTLPSVPDPSWQVRGAGDVNQDGFTDIIWEHVPSRQIWAWILGGDGTQLAWGEQIAAGMDYGSFRLTHVGDVDGDGDPDLFFRDAANGKNVVWRLDGARFVDGGALPDTDAGWAPETIGDVDGDQRADLIWRHQASGQLVVWYLEGARISYGEALHAPVVAGGWRVAGVRRRAETNGEATVVNVPASAPLHARGVRSVMVTAFERHPFFGPSTGTVSRYLSVGGRTLLSVGLGIDATSTPSASAGGMLATTVQVSEVSETARQLQASLLAARPASSRIGTSATTCDNELQDFLSEYFWGQVGIGACAVGVLAGALAGPVGWKALAAAAAGGACIGFDLKAALCKWHEKSHQLSCCTGRGPVYSRLLCGTPSAITPDAQCSCPAGTFRRQEGGEFWIPSYPPSVVPPYSWTAVPLFGTAYCAAS